MAEGASTLLWFGSPVVPTASTPTPNTPETSTQQTTKTPTKPAELDGITCCTNCFSTATVTCDICHKPFCGIHCLKGFSSTRCAECVPVRLSAAPQAIQEQPTSSGSAQQPTVQKWTETSPGQWRPSLSASSFDPSSTPANMRRGRVISLADALDAPSSSAQSPSINSWDIVSPPTPQQHDDDSKDDKQSSTEARPR